MSRGLTADEQASFDQIKRQELDTLRRRKIDADARHAARVEFNAENAEVSA